MLILRPFWFFAVFLAASTPCLAQPVSVWVANHSFELPALADSVFGSPFYNQQGGYGWGFSNAGLYNPPANTYASAGGNGTPLGADGVQVAFSLLGISNTISQRLIGPDNVLGNEDDPLLAASATYVLTVSIGARLPGNQYGIDAYGGYVIQLFAGSTLIAQEANAVTPPIGTFVDRTITVDTTTLDPILIGQPLAISMASMLPNAITDFDHVRLTVSVPEPALVLIVGAGCCMVISVVRYKTKRDRRKVKVTQTVLSLLMACSTVGIFATAINVHADEPKKDDVQVELSKLQGLWQCSPGGMEHRDGKQIVRNPVHNGPCFFVRGDKIIWIDGDGKPTGNEETITLDTKAEPKKVTFTSVSEGKKENISHGIYSATGSSLRIHMGLDGGPAPGQFLELNKPLVGVDGTEWLVHRKKLEGR